MKKDITFPAIAIVILIILCFNTVSDKELLEQCGDSESCKYAVVAH